MTSVTSSISPAWLWECAAPRGVLFPLATRAIGASQELRYVHVAGRYDGDVPYRQLGRAYS